MELSGSNIKRFLIFQEMELSSYNINKFLMFSQSKAFLIFQEMELCYMLGYGNPERNSLHFGKQNFLIFQETETPKTFLSFRN